MIYTTHGGIFHTDDVMGYVITKLAGICNNFVRVKDLDVIPKESLIADIGGIYCHNEKKYDHHQEMLYRDNGFPYATAGLLWHHYGRFVIQFQLDLSKRELPTHIQEEIWKEIDTKIMQVIDASDADPDYTINASCSGGELDTITLSTIINSMNSTPSFQEVAFYNASLFIKNFLTSQIEAEINRKVDGVKFDETAKFQTSEIVILNTNLRWRSHVRKNYPEVKFVITPSSHPKSKFILLARRINPKHRNLIVPIIEIPGFKGNIHLGKFIAGAETVEELVKLAQYSLDYVKNPKNLKIGERSSRDKK